MCHPLTGSSRQRGARPSSRAPFTQLSRARPRAAEAVEVVAVSGRSGLTAPLSHPGMSPAAEAVAAEVAEAAGTAGRQGSASRSHTSAWRVEEAAGSHTPQVQP